MFVRSYTCPTAHGRILGGLQNLIYFFPNLFWESWSHLVTPNQCIYLYEYKHIHRPGVYAVTGDFEVYMRSGVYAVWKSRYIHCSKHLPIERICLQTYSGIIFGTKTEKSEFLWGSVPPRGTIIDSRNHQNLIKITWEIVWRLGIIEHFKADSYVGNQ